MRTGFKVYKRKIHVFRRYQVGDLATREGCQWLYCWSTNAYKTCREAVEAAKLLHPELTFKANFARD